MLVQSFNDSDDEVRRTAASCFRWFDGRDLEEYVGLVNRYIESPAFTTQINPLIAALKKTTANIPELTVAACERFFDLAAGDMPNMNAVDTPTVANLVVRAYSQTSDTELRNRCLDLIDRMHLLGSYGLDNVMAGIDR